MFCPKCGKSVSDTDKFCRYCGANIHNQYQKERVNNSQTFRNTNVNVNKTYNGNYKRGDVIGALQSAREDYYINDDKLHDMIIYAQENNKTGRYDIARDIYSLIKLRKEYYINDSKFSDRVWAALKK